jgi:PAS domain S-box-containing protein
VELETRQGECEAELTVVRRRLAAIERERDDLRREHARLAAHAEEQRRASDQIAQREARFRSLFAALDSGFCIIEVLFDDQNAPVDYRFLETNAAFEQLTGLHEAVGKTARQLVPNLDAFWFETYGRVARTGEAVRFVNQAPAMDGRWFDVFAFRVGGAESRQVAIHFTNVTERIRTEEALRRSEERYRTLFTSLDAGFCVIELDFDGDGAVVDYRFLETNRAFEEQTGLAGAAGKSVRDLIPENEPFWYEIYGAVARTGTPARVTVQSPALHGWWFETNVFRLGGAGSREIAILFYNVTDRKRAEADTARLAALVASSRDAITGTTPEGIITSWNPGAEELYGYTAEEVMGRDVALIFPPDRTEERASIFARLLQGELVPPLDTVRLHKDGRRIEVEVRVSPIEDADGRIVGISAIARDSTERKRLERMQQDFIAMAGHDLATPVTVLRARAQLMQRRGAYDEEGLAAIVDQTQRMERLIVDLRDLVRLEAGQLVLRRSAIDLCEVARHAAARTRLQAGVREIRIETPDGEITGEWDADRLAQVLDNLLGNALKYSGDGADVIIRVERGNRAGETRVSVADHGEGIPTHALPHLFDRFYRVDRHDAASGLGLGLYIARMLVEAHGGRIWAESTPGVGSTFTFVLPDAVTVT